MPEAFKWVCTEDSSHVFDEDTEDHFCPIDPPYHGFLIKTLVQVEDHVPASSMDTKPADTPGTAKTPPPPPPPEVGLCVILMDASASMTDPAFKGSPLTRMRLVATNAASGIFDLERMQNNPHAFVAVFKFDDRVELMFVDTISNLLNRYDKDVRKFANYIYEELFKMQQGTDINKALQHAYDFVDKFLKKQLPGLPVKSYTPMKQRILRHDSVESVSIPNIRVLIYTDGMQYSNQGDRTLYPNPFREHPLAELNHDIVIGAFFGQETDEGCKELKGLLSRCPRHDVPQFFLFDTPNQMSTLKSLFRMASGASGFCPKCLELQLSQ
ncbi:MAG: VWA domain-containing protein [Williamsia sp.]|nr:VWA domain-containing protein [Williamsia sp.]